MKKLFLVLFTLSIFTTSLTSCREQSETEEAANDVENAAEDTGDEIENAVD